MPEELISKQEATSHISAGVLRSTYIFKWVSAFKPNLLTHIAGTAVGNSFSVLALNLPVLCLLWFPDHWYRGAGLGAAMFMDGLALGSWLFPVSSVFSLNSCTPETWFGPHKNYSKGMFLFYQNLMLLHLSQCCFPCPTDPFTAVPWYPVCSHWSLHGQCRRAGSPEDQSSHQQWARRAIGFGVSVKMRNRFGGLPVYNQLFPLCLFPCISRLSLCDSNRINS